MIHKPDFDPVDVHVGARLRAQRVAKGLSQDALGALVGVTFQQIQKYERGSNRIAASRLWRLAGALDVDVAYFFAGQDPAAAPPPPIGERQLLELAKSFRRIVHPRLRMEAVHLVRDIAEVEAETRRSAQRVSNSAAE